MKRLDVVLPEWTRVQWTSEKARRVWEPRISDITGAWLRLERWTVVDGFRDSCLTFCSPEYLPELSGWAASHGCVAFPQARVGTPDIYSAVPADPIAGERWQYRVIFTRPERLEEWHSILNDDDTDHDAIGRMLGFPDCCRDFFRRVWVDEAYKDTTWPMAENTIPAGGNEIAIDGGAAIECNILLRWLGPRLVSHLPCSFDCEPTIDVAAGFAEVAKHRQFTRQMDLAREMLSWPVEWDALHGIAEIRTPILRISSRTDMTEERYVVRRHGTAYPDEGATGLRFPFREPRAAPAVEEDSVPADNGFRTRDAMVDAHATILDVAGTPAPGSKILDLGCGDGRLVSELARRGRNVTPIGVDLDPKRIARARGREARGQFHVERIGVPMPRWADSQFDIVVLMPGRLLELPLELRSHLLKMLRERTQSFVFYAYGDWLTHGGLSGLLEAAGIPIGNDLAALKRGNGVEAVRSPSNGWN